MKPGRGSSERPPGSPWAGELSDPAPPAAPSPVALAGEGGDGARRGETSGAATRGPAPPVRSRSPATSSAGPGAGKVTGGGGGREGPGLAAAISSAGSRRSAYLSLFWD